MKAFISVVLLLAAGFTFYLVTQPRTPPAAASAVVPSKAAAAPPIRLRPAWPPVQENAPQLAGDLFARNYYVVLDGSGSMQNKDCSAGQMKMDAAKAALASFSQSVPAHANLGLQVFDARGVNELLPLGTGNRDQFTRLVNQVRPNGGTPLRSAVQKAYDKLLQQGAKQLGYGEYHLVIVTDGAANDGQDPTEALNILLAQSPIVVQTIGFCIGTNHSLNQPGRTIYRAAENPAELRQGLADVLAEAPQFAVTQFK